MDILSGFSIEDFLAWERRQPEAFEFDGVQAIPMTGAKVGHAHMITCLMRALLNRLPTSFEPFAGNVKVIIPSGQVRYPDVLIVPIDCDRSLDTAEPLVVFEVLSPSTEMTDLKVKSLEYQTVASIAAYVILLPDQPDATIVYRKATGWKPMSVELAIDLPEIGTALLLSELFV